MCCTQIATSAALPLLSALLHHFSSFRAAKIGPVKQAITSIERSYLFLVGGISLARKGALSEGSLQAAKSYWLHSGEQSYGQFQRQNYQDWRMQIHR